METQAQMADDTLVESASEASLEIEVQELDINWMLSGERACTVQVLPQNLVAEVKTQVLEKIGIAISEQRLFQNCVDELSGDVCIAEVLPLAALMLLRVPNDVRNTNLNHFRPHVDLKPFPSGQFNVVRNLSNAIYGTVSLCIWRSSASTKERVAVKKMLNEKVNYNVGKETSEWAIQMGATDSPNAEDALTEIGVLSYLARQPDLPRFVLQMRGAFADNRNTYLITEFAEKGELFAVAASGATLGEAKVRQYTWQLLQAVTYLHSHQIGHRDVSLENILVKGSEIRLMDFGMAVQTHAASGESLRYFRQVGKEGYRPPECFLPTGCAEVQVSIPAHAVTGEVAFLPTSGGSLCEVRVPAGAAVGDICAIELAGYTAPAVDVFASGICFFMLFWQVAPWRRAVPSGALADPLFAFVHKYCENGENGLERLLHSWGKPLLAPDAMKLLEEMLNSDPAQRPSAERCLASSWFESLQGTSVPLHVQLEQSATP